MERNRSEQPAADKARTVSDIFAQEQQHLTVTYKTLQKMEKDLEERIGSIAEKAAAEKLDIRENLALNFEGDSDSMETYIEFEVMNHAIDQYNIERDSAAEKLGRVKRLLKAPYFAKVQLRYEPDEDPEEYYIGSAGISENALEPLIIDWRSPVAEMTTRTTAELFIRSTDAGSMSSCFCAGSLNCPKTGCRPISTRRSPSRILCSYDP